MAPSSTLGTLLDATLVAARQQYEEAKILHNQNPKKHPFQMLERLRHSIEELEALAASPDRKRFLDHVPNSLAKPARAVGNAVKAAADRAEQRSKAMRAVSVPQVPRVDRW